MRTASEAGPLAAAQRRLGRPGRPRKTQAPASEPLPLISPRLLDLRGAAHYLGDMSTWTVRDLEAAGILNRVRIPLPNGGELRKVLFDRESLDHLIEKWKDHVNRDGGAQGGNPGRQRKETGNGRESTTGRRGRDARAPAPDH